MALADRVLASHYAEPVERVIKARAPLLTGPSGDAEVVRELEEGEPFAMLDDSVGWAWGYAGKDRRVGYVKSGALSGLSP